MTVQLYFVGILEQLHKYPRRAADVERARHPSSQVITLTELTREPNKPKLASVVLLVFLALCSFNIGTFPDLRKDLCCITAD